ncbi:MAG: RyR domain-containing protein, partial [Methylococcales bacterium]
MLTAKTTLILGEGPTAGKIRTLFGVSGKTRRKLSDPQETGFTRLILCVDEIHDITVTLERLGELCKANKPFAKNPLPVVLLSSKRNPPVDNETILEAVQGRPVLIRVCSIPSVAARRLLRRYPLHLSADGAFGQVVHVLIVGFSDLGIAIALHAMRLAHYGLGRPRLTIAESDPKRYRDDFIAEFPEARNVADIHFTDLDLSGLTEFPVTSVYLCDPGVSEITLRTESILESLRRRQSACPPLFLDIGELATSGELAAWDGRTYPFSALREVCDPDILFGDSEDELARIVHDYYRDSIAAQGRPLEGNPAGESWERLDDSYRQASRHQADQLTAKVVAIDCRFAAEHESEFFVFYPREVEKLAKIEHDRWSADRYLSGWKYGQVRDNEQKIHPELIPYDQLSEDMKDLDRYTVRLMPALLGRKGLAIRRNLIVGMITACENGKVGKSYIRSLDSLFERLTDRHPDRALVLAIDLADDLQRIVAKRAREKYQAVL